MIFATGVFVALVAAGAVAQGTSVSPQCQNAWLTASSGPAATCLAIPALIGVATTPANQSLVSPINNWLSNLCPQQPCDNSTLRDVMNTLTNACRKEFRIPSDNLQAQVVNGAVEYQHPARDMICLKDSSASDAFCVTQTLGILERSLGPFSFNALFNGSNVFTAIESLPADQICTPCTQAEYQHARTFMNDQDRSQTDNYMNQKCGANFATNPTPSSIHQSASGSGSGNGAPALGSGLVGLVLTALVAVAGLAAFGF